MQVLIRVGVDAPAREGTPMLKVVQDAEAAGENTSERSLLDEIVRDGARQMLAAALQSEVAAYVEAFADEVDDAGRRMVVRNGHHVEREVTTAAGPPQGRRAGPDHADHLEVLEGPSRALS